MKSLFAAGLAALVATIAVSGPWSNTLDGLSSDSLVWLRQAVFGPQHARSESPTVVIAIDEETYRREPFSGVPKVMWTPEIAQVFDAVIDGGATVIGMDIILPTSVASQIRGFDRDFLQSLRRHSRTGRMVLSKVQHSTQPILPNVGQRFAVGHGPNIRAANLYSDTDGIVRGVPVSLARAGDGATVAYEPSLAVDLAARALGGRLVLDTLGRAELDGVALPTVAGNNLLINFDDDQSGIPTFSFADIQACVAAGNDAFFEKNFAGRVVLFGGVLDVEDRKLSSLRFTAAPDAAAFGERCALDRLPDVLEADLSRDSVPGVYLHAFAVNNLVRGNLLSAAMPWHASGLTFVLAVAIALATIALSAWLAGTLAVVASAFWAVAAISLFQSGTVFPLFDPPIAMAVVFALMGAYRFTVADRDKRLLRQMFGLYLAPSVIEQMVERSEMPSLGGETRELTVFFSDLANFTAMSEGMNPEALVRILNDYLSAMTDVIERHGGFVDKYIGDAIVAVFGAPHHDAGHADHAIAAAIECQHRLEALNADMAAAHGITLGQRIGINTGRILVGNIGSARRFNYTVMGDAVNLAARLEGANKVYGTTILLSQETLAQGGDQGSFRRIDQVRVVGRAEPVILHTPADGTPAETLDVYARALADYDGGRFAAAVALWETISAQDPPAAAMAVRARLLDADRPDFWDGVYALDVK
ncbi:MAG: adenylate/guanylate cyclase domain-containing protein [Rhodospirillaceae bacterium]|nr:adenylate/guanylate cyclase domain-containing protein [Rhodospirillaceae bacterium]